MKRNKIYKIGVFQFLLRRLRPVFAVNTMTGWTKTACTLTKEEERIVKNTYGICIDVVPFYDYNFLTGEVK